MKNLIISPEIEVKLIKKHGVRRIDIIQCFLNKEGSYLEDTRINNATIPPTLWFISETHQTIPLKIVFVFKDGNIYLKTAYPPNEHEIRIYNRIGKSL